jgi:hypothetical protein
MEKQIATKTVEIEGVEYCVRVFESAEAAAERVGRKTPVAQYRSEREWERRQEQLAEFAHVTGHSALSEPYEADFC